MPCAVLSSTLPAEGPTKCILIAIYITAHTDVYQSKQSKHWRLPAGLIVSERVTRSIQLASQIASKILIEQNMLIVILTIFIHNNVREITSSGHLEKQTDKSEHFWRFECCAMSNICSICYFKMDEFSISLPVNNSNWYTAVPCSS